MNHVKKLLDNKIPFSVMQYFEYLKTDKTETHKKYELIYIEDVIIKKEITFKILKSKELAYFKENVFKFEIVLANNNGIIWEFGNFKQYAELTQKNK